MSLVFNQIDLTKPQTHVFIVAVGHYPYLIGGESAPRDPIFGGYRLGQLTSPPVSAKNIYDTIINLHRDDNWIRPLGSIEMLVSARDNTFAGPAVESASRQNIETRYFEWLARCHTSSDNVALFFFCGHGLEKGEHYLLAEDFGQNVHNPWTGAFAFDITRRAFHQCRAETQLFFVDACRQVTPQMLTEDLIVAPFQQPSILTPECKYNLTIKATAANEAAYGRPGEPSFFTRAILKALCGDAAFKEDGHWKISTNNIAGNINKIIRMIEPLQDYPQRCNYTSNDSANIIRLSKTPSVNLEVSCNPDAALEFAALSYKNMNFEDKEGSRDPAASPWLINLEAGIYKLDANFSCFSFKNATAHVSVMPPFTKEKLKCYE